MEIIKDYFVQNYITLAALLGLIVMLIANRHTEIKGVGYFRSIMLIVLALTLLEALEDWCDVYNMDYHILYFKSTLVYCFYPLIALLEIFLIIPIMRKWLMSLPYLVNMLFAIIDLSGTGFIYYFLPNHTFQGGVLRPLPLVTLGIYVVLLAVWSFLYISQGSVSKGMIVVYIAISTVITLIALYAAWIPDGYAQAVTAIDLLVYYFYLAAIQHSEVQSSLHEREIELQKNRQELQQSKTRLLVAQIQPHFIYNSLMALQAKSIDNPEVYSGIKDFGDYLRSNFTAMTNNEIIPFEEELKCIKAYLHLERLNYGDKLNVKYDIEIDQFMVPALCVEPLVENAVRYGIGTYEKGGTVEIIVRDEPDYIEIEVHDDGSGGNKLTDAQKDRKSIGLQNVRLRLSSYEMGELDITQDETGTHAVIKLKYMEN